MKKIFLLLSIITLTLQSCSSSDSSSNTPLTVEAVQNIARSGTWKITYLDTQGGAIKTSDFQGYSFTFNQTNNTVAANSSNLNYTGLWSIHDGISDNIHFSMYFQDPISFQRLEGDYDLISINNNKIVLKLNSSILMNDPSYDPIFLFDDLTFEKN